MTAKSSDQATLKKLMKIIYDKQKQIDKYRKQLRQREKVKPVLVQPPQLGLSCEQKNYITKQIIQNKRFLQTATVKLHGMEAKILQLQADLEEQQNRNHILQQQINSVKIENEEKDRIIVELTTIKQLLQNAKISNNGEISEKEGQIQTLILENQKIKIIYEQIKIQNSSLKQKIRNIETQVNKTIKFMHKNFRVPNKSQIDLNFGFSRMVKRSQQQIKTHTFIVQKLQQTLQQKIRQAMEGLKKWEQTLIKREQEWKKNFQKGLSEHSFDGISHVVSQSIIMKDENLEKLQKNINILKSENNFYETSVYKRNEQQLLKQLERQCQKSCGPVSIQKQKLVELSQIKQSLKLTKQVNEQLFDELGKQQNIIKVFKETFKSLQQKKLLKNENAEQLVKLRSVLGIKNG